VDLDRAKGSAKTESKASNRAAAVPRGDGTKACESSSDQDYKWNNMRRRPVVTSRFGFYSSSKKKVKRKGLILTASQVLKSERDSNRKAPPVRERCHLQHLFRALQSLMLVSQVTTCGMRAWKKHKKGMPPCVD
jgi:hypothetical protein